MVSIAGYHKDEVGSRYHHPHLVEEETKILREAR